MKKSARLILFTTLCAALALVFAPGQRARGAANADASAPRERHFEFEYKATVKDVPAGAKKVELWIPIPHDSPFQQITDMRIESPYPYQIHKTQYGNRDLHIIVSDPQQPTFIVTLRFNAVRLEHVQGKIGRAHV